EHADLVRGAAYGSTSETNQHADAEAELVAQRVAADHHVAVVRETATSLLASPMLLRGNFIGVLVLQRVRHGDFSAEDIRTLETICAQLVGIVENARIIDALDRGER